MAASSVTKLRASAIIMPIVSSGTELPPVAPVVWATMIPCARAASMSTAVLRWPVATSSRSRGSRASTPADSVERSRMATTISLSPIRAASSAGSW
jgi:hypothetical protein